MFLTPAIEAATTIGASAHIARRLSFSWRNEAIPFSEHKTVKQLRRNVATGFSAYGSQCSEVEEASGLKRLPLAVGHFTGGEVMSRRRFPLYAADVRFVRGAGDLFDPA